MKTILFILVIVGLAASSCSTYTCPTYAKHSKPNALHAQKIWKWTDKNQLTPPGISCCHWFSSGLLRV